MMDLFTEAKTNSELHIKQLELINNKKITNNILHYFHFEADLILRSIIWSSGSISGSGSR